LEFRFRRKKHEPAILKKKVPLLPKGRKGVSRGRGKKKKKKGFALTGPKNCLNPGGITRK